jgi:hypothetical protein
MNIFVFWTRPDGAAADAWRGAARHERVAQGSASW